MIGLSLIFCNNNHKMNASIVSGELTGTVEIAKEIIVFQFNSRSLGNDQTVEKVLKIPNIELYTKQKGKSNKSGVGEILNKAIQIFAASETLNASIVSGELTGTVEIAKEMLETEFEWSFSNPTRSPKNTSEDLASMIE